MKKARTLKIKQKHNITGDRRALIGSVVALPNQFVASVKFSVWLPDAIGIWPYPVTQAETSLGCLFTENVSETKVSRFPDGPLSESLPMSVLTRCLDNCCMQFRDVWASIDCRLGFEFQKSFNDMYHGISHCGSFGKIMKICACMCVCALMLD